MISVLSFRSQIKYQLLRRWASQTSSNTHPCHGCLSYLQFAFLFLHATYCTMMTCMPLFVLYLLSQQSLVFVRPETILFMFFFFTTESSVWDEHCLYSSIVSQYLNIYGNTNTTVGIFYSDSYKCCYKDSMWNLMSFLDSSQISFLLLEGEMISSAFLSKCYVPHIGLLPVLRKISMNVLWFSERTIQCSQRRFDLMTWIKIPAPRTKSNVYTMSWPCAYHIFFLFKTQS